jgi:hypothetical protein
VCMRLFRSQKWPLAVELHIKSHFLNLWWILLDKKNLDDSLEATHLTLSTFCRTVSEIKLSPVVVQSVT